MLEACLYFQSIQLKNECTSKAGRFELLNPGQHNRSTIEFRKAISLARKILDHFELKHSPNALGCGEEATACLSSAYAFQVTIQLLSWDTTRCEVTLSGGISAIEPSQERIQSAKQPSAPTQCVWSQSHAPSAADQSAPTWHPSHAQTLKWPRDPWKRRSNKMSLGCAMPGNLSPHRSPLPPPLYVYEHIGAHLFA